MCVRVALITIVFYSAASIVCWLSLYQFQFQFFLLFICLLLSFTYTHTRERLHSHSYGFVVCDCCCCCFFCSLLTLLRSSHIGIHFFVCLALTYTYTSFIVPHFRCNAWWFQQKRIKFHCIYMIIVPMNTHNVCRCVQHVFAIFQWIFLSLTQTLLVQWFPTTWIRKHCTFIQISRKLLQIFCIQTQCVELLVSLVLLLLLLYSLLLLMTVWTFRTNFTQIDQFAGRPKFFTIIQFCIIRQVTVCLLCLHHLFWYDRKSIKIASN